METAAGAKSKKPAMMVIILTGGEQPLVGA